MGLQFENLVVNNAMDVASMIGIGNATIESAAPYRNARKDRNGKSRGCQIDLLIQTPKAAYVVEVKRRGEIGPEIEQEVQRKIDNLPLRAGMTPRPVLDALDERPRAALRRVLRGLGGHARRRRTSRAVGAARTVPFRTAQAGRQDDGNAFTEIPTLARNTRRKSDPDR